MAELADKRREQFARLLSIGMAQGEAYAKAGFRSGDRSNASKLARDPEIVIRVEELKAEETIRQARLKEERGDLSGLEELKKAIAGAAGAGNWAAVVSGAKVLGDADGSLDALGEEASRRPLTLAEILALAKELDPTLHLWFDCAALLMLVDAETGKPLEPWRDSNGKPIPPYLSAEKGLVLE